MQCSSHRRLGLDPWVRKIPWRRARKPTPVFFLWTEEPGGLQSTGSQSQIWLSTHTRRHLLGVRTSDRIPAIMKLTPEMSAGVLTSDSSWHLVPSNSGGAASGQLAGSRMGAVRVLWARLVTISLAPFQIPQTVRATGASGLFAVSPVGMATRNGPGLVAMRVLQPNPGRVTVPAAQVGALRGVALRSRRSFSLLLCFLSCYTISKCYAPLTVITKYWLCFTCCVIHLLLYTGEFVPPTSIPALWGPSSPSLLPTTSLLSVSVSLGKVVASI